MPYTPHTNEDIKEILECLGENKILDLFKGIPHNAILQTALELPPPLSEKELAEDLAVLANKNSSVEDTISFLGGGFYNHYIPSIINHLTSRSEFYTAYTPYQPEISQGTLQAIFEYQTLLCQLTGMEIANASMYDGASATAEAILMALRINKKPNVLISSALHPEYREVVNTYLSNRMDCIKEVHYCTEKGQTLPEALNPVVDEETSCVVVQSPNYFGCIEDLRHLSKVVHSKGALFIVVVTEPLSLAILKPPGEYGADIVVGEGQSFGIPLSFGGPTLGFFTTLNKYVRQAPGRIVGETADLKGKKGYVLTLSTREQHIRREKSTSNICTNEGLCALTASIYLSIFGKNGLKKLALTNLGNAHYARETLEKISHVSLAFTSPFFNEFTVETPAEPEALLKHLQDKGILGGIPLYKNYPDLSRDILLTVTEMNSKGEIEKLADEINSFLHK
ncbi:MAG: aminomethyl-transferring glycine dehydrogenase subunit GcvPA [Thermodesulfobacteriota bacterium]